MAREISAVGWPLDDRRARWAVLRVAEGAADTEYEDGD